MSGLHAGGPLRVLIADDQRIFAESLQMVLMADERIEVVGLAEDGERAVELATGLEPDLILMDIRMPRMDGIEAIRRIRAAGCRSTIVVLAASDSGRESAAAFEAGATAFVDKAQSLDSFMETFFEVASLTAVFGAATDADR